MSKKQIIGVLIIVVALLFAGCSEETTQTTSEGADTASTAETASTIAEAATQTTEGNAETTEQTTQETESGMDIISDEKSETSAAMESTMTSSSETSTETIADTSSSEENSGVEEYTVKAFRYGYQPDTLTVKKGDLVKITIDNTDGTHGMRLQDFGVEDMEYVEFTPDKTGTFTWYCNNFCGSGHSSMSGTLIVEE